MLDKYYHTKDIYYTKEKMLAYMRNQLPDFEKRAFEKLMEEDPFLRDSYEGLKMQSMKENQRVFQKIEADIDIITGSKKPRIISLNTRTLAVAAMLIVFIAVSFLIITQLNKTQQEKIAIIQAEEYTNPVISENKADSVLQKNITELSPPEQTAQEIIQPVVPVENKLEIQQDNRQETNSGAVAFEPRPTDIEDGNLIVIESNDDKESDTMVFDEITLNEKSVAETTSKKSSDAVPTAPTVDANIFVTVEQMPEFPGGDEAMYKFLAENIKYPALAKDNMIQGTVYIKFVVSGKGKISDAVVVRGIGSGCDEEALRVVKKMPNWNPGMQQGKPVDVFYTLPIKFQLQ
ncbi:MAG: TonB family protein [Chitinophagales bacterium]|nr:TonB family protein [Bacteroidota bacterium]MBP7398501.1 TonB family protein [Chitinophagales bacterium]MBP8752862.1 TonB family protein [Chitinophagales bacterium]MBP9704509.1 TonB family protein [Chitinophagales bacterium]